MVDSRDLILFCLMYYIVIFRAAVAVSHLQLAI